MWYLNHIPHLLDGMHGHSWIRDTPISNSNENNEKWSFYKFQEFFDLIWITFDNFINEYFFDILYLITEGKTMNILKTS